MKHQFKTDEDILQALRSGEASREHAALKFLYQDDRLFNTVVQQIRLLGGDRQDAREMLNEALMEFDQQVRRNQYDPAQSKVHTYLVSIAKNKYRTSRRTQERMAARHERAADLSPEETESNPEQHFSRQHKKDLLEQATAALGEKCHQLLAFFSLDYSMQEIAAELHYKSADVAKSALYDCRKRLHSYLTERPALVAALREL